ncbi:MAG: prolyl oligopeptidase family serine peptidase [Bacteroidales bacterium]|nr:prolyl oligopeptidase family serine peptidase [Bacteroidales bacterium]
MMKNALKMSVVLIFIIMMGCSEKKIKLMDYPITKKVDTVDTYFGVQVPDPYRWLEDDMSAETAEWVAAQNKVTFNYLEQIPFRQAIKDRLTEMWDYPKYGTPFRKGKYFFFFKNEGMQNQSVLYIQEGLDGEPRVFLDPNELSADGTTSISALSVSNNIKYLGYGISKAGSDWNEFYVMDIETGAHLDDKLEWIKFSGIAWEGDGFYYSRYDAPTGSELSVKNENHKICYHRIGTSQQEDIVIFENREFPLRNFSASVTLDETYLSIYESETTQGNALYVKNLKESGAGFIKIADGFEYDYTVVENIGNKILIFTNKDAPMYKLVLVDPLMPEESNWQTIIPESEDVLRSVNLAGDKIIAEYLKDASSRVYLYDYEGQNRGELNLPGIGTLGSFSSEKDDNVAFYSYASFTFPSTIYKFDVSQNTSEIYKSSDIDFDPSAYEIKQVFYTSKDGTRVPMFIVHKKGIELDGKNPTLLYGYGGFNVSVLPSFSLSRLLLLENDGIYAVANIRGGGEYGKDWHDAGTKLNKQNVFDDFIAAAEYLIDNNYTNPQKLAIQGGSNGGLLIGACINQRPELFKVALPAVGVMDMLRFHKFTIGWAWTGDYGSSEDSTEFNYLYKYSPLHNIREGINYPATLVTTADHDDRVVPAHSFKYIATLQEKHRGENPVLIRIDTQAGHGAGKPTEKIIEEAADIWAFTFYNLGIKPKYKSTH